MTKRVRAFVPDLMDRSRLRAPEASVEFVADLAVLLDEPASALDPIARLRLLQFLLELLHEDQSTILISSHILHDVEQVIDWVICLDRGRVRVDTGLDSLQIRMNPLLVRP